MVSTRWEISERGPRRLGAGVVLVGLLAGCQATDKPAFVIEAEQNIEAERRRINQQVSERTERLGAMAAVLTGCSLERRKAYELDPEQEETLGRAVAERELTTLGVEPLPATNPVARYVDQVGQYLALVAEAVGSANGPDRAKRPERLLDNRPWPRQGYRFVVVPADEPRAMGTPGGTVMISTGFLRTLESEEELAAVLAHEVAHVQRGHGVEVLKAFMCRYDARQESSAMLRAFRRRSRSQSPPASGSLPAEQEAGVSEELLRRAAQEAANLYQEGFPKDFELEADRISIRILLAAGYDAREFIELLRRMARESPASHAWLRMHPPPVERLKGIVERLDAVGPSQSWPPEETVAPRTKRFLEAMEPLKASAGAQAAH